MISAVLISKEKVVQEIEKSGELNFSLMFALGRFKSRKCLGLCGRELRVSLVG